jgi:PAS domain S-box-containing protein
VRDIPSRLEFLFFDIPALRPGTAGAYLLAFVSVGVATALRLAIDPYVGGLQFATFLPAVILTTLISGLGAGLFSVALSAAAIAFFVLPPRLSLYIEKPADLLAILLYAVVMLFNVSVITGMRLALARRRDQEALQESRERLALALDTTQLGWWQYDPRRNVASWDSRGLEILGRADEAPFAESVRQIHPDDREGFLAARAAALDPSDPKLFVYAFRVIRKDGTVGWVESHGLPHFEGAGPGRQLVSLGGAIQDVTEARNATKKSTFSCARLIIALRTCSASWTRSPTRPPPEIPKTFSNASPNAFGRSPPIRICSFGTNGRGSMSRTLSAPSSRTSRISLVRVSPCKAQSCT